MIKKKLLNKNTTEKKAVYSKKAENIFTIKVNKSIEILIVPSLGDKNTHQENVGIVLEENDILRILSKRYNKVVVTCIKNKNDLIKLVERKPDLVFSGVKFFNFGHEQLWLNDFLETYNIPYIGSNTTSLNNESNKDKAKEIVLTAGVKTAEFFIAEPGQYKSLKKLPIAFPFFIKPLKGGDSRGVDNDSICYNYKSFKKKVLDIKNKYNLSSIIETYLSGKEYSVGIFQESITGNLTAMPIEIITKKNMNGHCILDYDIKKNDEETVTAVTDTKVFNELIEIGKKSFTALGGKSFGRIDIKMNHLGEAHFMEANLMPGLRKGYFYRSCKLNLNINYDEMILNIANTGLTSNNIRH